MGVGVGGCRGGWVGRCRGGWVGGLVVWMYVEGTSAATPLLLRLCCYASAATPRLRGGNPRSRRDSPLVMTSSLRSANQITAFGHVIGA